MTAKRAMKKVRKKALKKEIKRVHKGTRRIERENDRPEGGSADMELRLKAKK